MNELQTIIDVQKGTLDILSTHVDKISQLQVFFALFIFCFIGYIILTQHQIDKLRSEKL